MPQTNKKFLSIILLCLSSAIALGLAEGLLRIKNSSMTNYDIEMWRYGKELKTRRPEPMLDFDHVRSKSAILQNVEIRLNEHGLRGAPLSALPPGGRRILFLGASITFGWGVSEQDTLEARLETALSAIDKQPVQVLNAGVGNYNTERYVSRFFDELTGLHPTDIVVHYCLRDAEDLPAGGDNLLLRHSQLAVILWGVYHRFFDKNGEQSMVQYYRDVYQPEAPGMLKMKEKLRQLSEYAKANNIRIYLAMTPITYNLVDYKFGFVHDIMKQVSAEYGYTYCDQLPTMKGVPPKDIWAMPTDPHPNALGHRLMAEAILPMLSQSGHASVNN
ncbi:hypothetical protein JWZ98_02775 [Methylomonas sp. EFPC1]|uniref:SGNH/GDSL hydrolase family protein n=1 Tax=unclassified Methylomonas TaxID=2608980 RepID=UPI00068BF497|nr:MULTISPECIES: GDSL-type esterase/lipase family protein [unclassified Methylomonas]QBC26054.1 hypothetical protein U737_03490 [Methylomonas sp. LW13]QSB01900.1 hypothetical protein JWZ98_02775 [Methylomonas sp. EFPC1]